MMADVLRRNTTSGGARASSPPRTRRFQDQDDLVPQPQPHPASPHPVQASVSSHALVLALQALQALLVLGRASGRA